MPESTTTTAPKAPRLWTARRKLFGNLLPFLLAAPLGAFGVWRMFETNRVFWEGILWLLASVAVLWLSVNSFGLFQNEAVKRAMRRRLEASLTPSEIPPDPMFVGFAKPSFRSAVDPHEDVGFLLLHEDRVEFFGDKERITLPKSCLLGARLRPNPHSWAFLGGWVSLEGMLEGRPVRMLLEPRERSTLRGNRKLRSELKKRLDAWLGN